MILYNYEFDRHSNRIIIAPVEVIETTKMYKTKSRDTYLANYVSQISKDSLNTLILSVGIYMVSHVSDVDMFKQMLAKQLDEEYQSALKKANEIMRTIDILPECKIVDRSNES